MNVEQELVRLGEADHVLAVDVNYEPHRMGYTWRVTVRRDRPIHVTQGSGQTLEAACNDLRRTMETQ